jgi:hypothetical protein
MCIIAVLKIALQPGEEAAAGEDQSCPAEILPVTGVRGWWRGLGLHPPHFVAEPDVDAAPSIFDRYRRPFCVPWTLAPQHQSVVEVGPVPDDEERAEVGREQSDDDRRRKDNEPSSTNEAEPAVVHLATLRLLTLSA